MRVSHLSVAFIGLAIVPAIAAQNHPGTVKAVLQSGPDVGQRAPDFSLPWANRDGVGPVESPYQLASDRGKTVVVAFYPRDFTKGCTAQLRTFAEQYDSLFGPNVVVVGGSWLCPAAEIRAGNWNGITAICQRTMKSLEQK